MQNERGTRIPLAPIPQLVATIGLHGSASTWVFNVVREIMTAGLHGQNLLVQYNDEANQLPDDTTIAGQHLLIKSHRGSDGFDAWLAQRHATLILSIRDPRDACLSMVQRFGLSLDIAARMILQDCERLMHLGSLGHPILRYEGRFFDQQQTVAMIGQFLGQTLPSSTIETIFVRYGTQSVRDFAAQVPALPPNRLRAVAGRHIDRLTQIHSTHIGDTASGKWTRLPTPLREALTGVMAPFLDRFGYPREA
jgi:hypothetical protein